MKRSEINGAIDYTVAAAAKFRLPLPPFAFYTPDDWRALTSAEEELVDNMLGWDVTDFGMGNFLHTGLTVFTFRNGNFYKKDQYPKPYCEKLLFVRDGQILPFHFHWQKIEDIIHRGGGILRITLYNNDGNGGFADTPVEVTVDGKKTTVAAGGALLLQQGQSVTLLPSQYHQWQGVPGTGDIALFEVSTTNDDRTDNRFYAAQSRLPEVEEDATAQYLLFQDYAAYVAY